MKTINTFFLAILVTSIVGLGVSCETVSNPESIKVIDTTKTATLEGMAYANLDETNDTTNETKKDYERVPDGTTVKVVINNSEYKAGANGTSSYNTTVNQNGNYSIDIPATDGSINAEVYYGNFQASQVQADSSTEQKQFTPQLGNPYTVSVVAGITEFQDIIYNAN